MLIENEYKTLICREAYNCISSIINWTSEINQTNYYYLDENKKILQDGNTLRIRKIGKKKVLQFKKYIDNSDSLHIREEFETPVDSIPVNLDEKLLLPFCNEQYKNIKLIGSLETKRKIFKNNHFMFCLDKNTFLKSTDYEIEIEIYNKEANDIFDFNNPLYNMFKDNTVGKFSRFYNKYMELNYEFT